VISVVDVVVRCIALDERNVLLNAADADAPSWRLNAPRNQDESRPFTERTYRSSPARTTHIVSGLRNVPSRAWNAFADKE